MAALIAVRVALSFRSDCLSSQPYLSSDLADVATVSTAAAAPYVDVRKPPGETSHLAAKFHRVAIFKVAQLAE